MNFDWKHLVAIVTGIVLGILGTQFGIDFSKSCPATSPSIMVSPVPTK